MPKINLSRFNSAMGPLIIMALAINNLIAFIFFSIAFLNPYCHCSETAFIFRMITYGLVVSAFFSLISFGINYRFKSYFSTALTDRLKFFLLQVTFLFLIFVAMLFSVFFVFPALS
jgi:hypothetical protein